MKKPPPTISVEEREIWRRRIRDAREHRSAMVVSAADMEQILDAYEALRHANNRLLDLLHPRKETA